MIGIPPYEGDNIDYTGEGETLASQMAHKPINEINISFAKSKTRLHYVASTFGSHLYFLSA